MWNRKKAIYIILIVIGIIFITGCKSKDYKEAVMLFKAGDYSTAKEVFLSIEDYKDSKNYLSEIDYRNAINEFNAGDYTTAYEIFSTIESLNDSKDYLLKIDKLYSDAVVLFEQQKYAEAIQAFTALNGFQESKLYLDRAKETLYNRAVESIKKGDIDSALLDFNHIKTYNDAANYIKIYSDPKSAIKEYCESRAKNRAEGLDIFGSYSGSSSKIEYSEKSKQFKCIVETDYRVKAPGTFLDGFPGTIHDCFVGKIEEAEILVIEYKFKNDKFHDAAQELWDKTPIQ